jgi:uncharacterized protein YbjT (DUF2867 family)
VAASVPGGPALVLGASGYVGSHLVPRLTAAGLAVRAASRSLAALDRQPWRDVERMEVDVLDRDSVRRAMHGIRTVWYLVHLMSGGRDLEELERVAAANVAAAAAETGVERIVYLGALAPPDPGSAHVRARRDTGERLRAGPVPVTEVRAGIIVGPGSAAFEVMRDLVLNLPLMVTPRWVRSKSPPIALDDLLEYLVRLPAQDGPAHGVYDVGGPELLTYEQKMRTLARLAGRREPWIVPVPVLTPRLSSYWLGLVTAVPTNVARALIEGLKHDFLAHDAPARERVPLRLATFEEAVARTFELERAQAHGQRFREGDFAMRGERHEHAWYAKRAGASAIGDVPADAVWRQVAGIGGENGYYYLDWLWRLRELMDAAVGGGGLARGRAHPDEVRVGDRIDTWEVVGIEPGRRLTMRFGMRAPGAGGLEFEVQPLAPRRTRVAATAFWHPKGVAGLLYWYAMAPAHAVIFDGLTRAILARAAAAD